MKPTDNNTADTATWRYVGRALPDLDAVPGPLILDVLQRTPSPANKLIYCETQYLGNGEFHGVYGETVYWCYQRPMPAEYLTEAEASADLDACGYAGKWAKAKAEYDEALQAGELCPADYWLAVRLCFLELGGGWLKDKHTPAPIDWPAVEKKAMQSNSLAAVRQPYAEPQSPRHA